MPTAKRTEMIEKYVLQNAPSGHKTTRTHSVLKHIRIEHENGFIMMIYAKKNIQCV